MYYLIQCFFVKNMTKDNLKDKRIPEKLTTLSPSFSKRNFD